MRSAVGNPERRYNIFTVDPAITDIKIREKKPFKVLFSMNIHPVANPEMSLEDARTYVFFCREGRDKISVYIGLHFLISDRKLFYSHSVNPFADGQLSDMEEEARRFGEDLGAMLDEVDFNRMSNQEQVAWINDLEILSGRKKETVVPQEPAPDQATPGINGEQAAAPPQNAAPQPAPVQPAPGQAAPAQPSPVQAAPVQQIPVQTAQIQPHVQQPVPEVSPAQAPAASVQVQAAPPSPAPAVKPVQPRQPRKAAVQSRPAEAPDPEQASPPRVDDVLEEAVRAGVVRAPKAQLKNHMRSATGVVSREKEALARLLASF